MTPTRFGQPKYRDAEGYFQVRYRSPATRLAISAAAARLRTNTSSVLLATFAVGLARFTGNSPVMAFLMVNNRFRPGFAESVSALTQVSPFLVDVAGTTLAETVTRARGGAMRAYQNAYYDPRQQDRVIERVNADRGVTVDFSCFYNDRRQSERDPVGAAVPTPDDIRAAAGSDEFELDDEPSLPRQKLYFHVADPPGAIDFIMSVDAKYFDVADTEAILRGMADVAVGIALDPTAPTGV